MPSSTQGAALPGVRGRLSFFGLTPQRVGAFVALTVLAGVFEGFGMAMFLPVLEFIEKGRDVSVLAAGSPMWDKLIKAFGYLDLPVTLVSLLAAALGTMMLRVVFIYGRQVYAAWLSQEVLHVTRSNLFDAYLGMDYEAYTGLSSGGIVNVLTTEAQRAGGSFSSLFGVASNAVVLVGFACVLLWLSAPLTAMAVAFLALAGVVVAYVVRHTRKFSYKATKANDRYSRMVLERLGGYRLVKLTATGEREAGRVRAASGDVRDMLYWLAKLVAGVDLVMEPMVLLAGGGILYAAVTLFHMSLSEVGLFVLILLRMLPLAKEMLKSWQGWRACTGSLRAVLGGYDDALAEVEQRGNGRDFGNGARAIELEGVTFSYKDGERPALDRVDLSIPAGKVTALVGPSGAGKTTLADIIPALRRPQGGRVLYDGVPAEEFDLASLRRGMAFVSQDAVILDDTVAENMRFSRPEATEVEIWDALRRACADAFVRSLPQGIETRLGERGTKVSGGQKQRLSLARALLQDAGILILDEPTSALDSETERDIQRAIDDLRECGGATIVIIAHRLSTIRGADQIVVLEGGRVVEKGTHEDLVVSEEWYARVSGMQSTGASERIEEGS